MSYPQLSPDNYAALLSRKELYSLKGGEFLNPPGEHIDVSFQLKINSYQLFVQKLLAPGTNYKRLHLQWPPGVGKTIGALAVAMEYIRVYSSMYSIAATGITRRNLIDVDKMTPTVWVLGFSGTRAAFMRDLYKYPYFGFVSASEYEELLRRQNLANSGSIADIKRAREYNTMLKRRITTKSRGGFFKFYGYDEFVNRLFYSDKMKMIDLENITTQRIRAGENVTLEQVFRENIKSGMISVNQVLLKAMENSLIICDEIHETYNSQMKNNRGVAIQYILDTVASVRFLSLSASPINNSPTELVDWMNYLVDSDKKVTKAELFNGRELLPDALERIEKLLFGKISVVYDADIKYFPEKIFEGQSLIIPRDIGSFHSGDELPYLRFIKCPMSEFHQATYDHYVETYKFDMITMPEVSVAAKPEFQFATADGMDEKSPADEETPVDMDEKSPVYEETPAVMDEKSPADMDEETPVDMDEKMPEKEQLGVEEDIILSVDDDELFDHGQYQPIPIDGYAIYDIVFPSPDGQGIFKSGDIKNKLSQAPTAWKQREGINMKKSRQSYIITGNFLRRQNIEKYSTKYAMLLDLLMNIIRARPQKTMIYHNRVQFSGVLLIQELLFANGIINEYAEPVDNTLCVICGQTLSEHSTASDHEFMPVRFIIVHHDMEANIRAASIAKYNQPDNINGHKYAILIGSKIIRQSYHFTGIQQLIITSAPISMPGLRQIIGRCARKGSHVSLPEDQRKVHINILVTTSTRGDPISPEMYKYIDKMFDYNVIQVIEQSCAINAIDAEINRYINMPDDLKKIYFPNGTSSEPIKLFDGLYFEPARRLPNLRLSDLSTATFIRYGYQHDEVRTIIFIIKRLFQYRPVWTYDDLWANVKVPPFGIEINPELFLERNFAIAISYLSHAQSTGTTEKVTHALVMDSLYDASIKYIYRDGFRCIISHIGEYFIASPVVLATSPTPNSSHFKTTVDVESYQRNAPPRRGMRLDFKDVLDTSDTVYEKELAKLKNYSAENVLIDFSIPFQIKMVSDIISKETIKNIENIFNQLGALVTRGEIRLNKDVEKLYVTGAAQLFIESTDDKIVGYCIRDHIKLFNGADWITVSRISLNRSPAFVENDIVGILDSVNNVTKLKLRRSVTLISADVRARGGVIDTRLIEKGIVCETKPKADLIKLAKNIGVKPPSGTIEQTKVKNICVAIRTDLIKREIAARNAGSKTKFLYGWWDEEVDVNALV
jgi:hypothetical protein